MSSRWTQLIVDCQNPQALAQFWCAALGYKVIEEEEDMIEIAVEEPTADAIRQQPIPPSLLFIQVPETKTVKNRLHIDLRPFDCDESEEVARLLALGAQHTDVGQGAQTWTVLADPEGNEFCVLRHLRP